MGLSSKIINLLTVQPKVNTQPVSMRSQVPSTTDASAKKTGKANILKALLKPLNLALDYQDDFQAPETDFAIIDTAYETEAYVRQGLDKYIDFMFKAGWKFTGKNEAATEYIKQRFQWMAEVTRIPTELFFLEYAEDVVKYSNAVIVKARMKDQTQIPQGLTITGLDGKQPIAGYFLLNITTMSVKRDKNGAPKQWQQEVPGQDKEVVFKAEDIIHTYYKRKKGAAFAIPFLVPVLDDIRALRQVEDNILRNLYRNVFPFYHVSVGTEAAPAEDLEIDSMTATIQNMSTEGGLVTSERVKITPIAADKIVDAAPYLRHYEERVFTGLGVPGTMFGRAATANKSTSDNQARDFVDRCKAFNRLIEANVNEFMVKELLYEGGFDPIMNPDDMVSFKFNEIDVDMMIKQRNQAIFEYEHNSTTEDEMRIQLGLDPIPDSGPERDKMHLSVVKLSQLEMAAELKPDSNNSETDNKVDPKNQHSDFMTYKSTINQLQDDITFEINESAPSNQQEQQVFTLKTKAMLDSAYTNGIELLKDHKDNNVLVCMHQQLFNDITDSVIKAIQWDKDIGDINAQISNLFNIVLNRVDLTFGSILNKVGEE